MIEPKTISVTSDNTGTLLSRNTPRQMPVLSDVVIMLFSSILVLLKNRQFLDFATIALSELFRVQFLEAKCIYERKSISKLQIVIEKKRMGIDYPD